MPTSSSITPPAGSLHRQLDQRLRDAIESARAAVDLSSPFVGASTTMWMEKVAVAGPASWRLLTCLDPVAAAYGSLHLPGLRNLLNAGVSVRHLDNLHAKIFLTEACGFVGSANLTAAGLDGGPRSNRELTVELDDDQRQEALLTFDEWFEDAEPVTTEMIKACSTQAAKIPARVSRQPVRSKATRELADKADDLLDGLRDGQAWVKAVYRSADQADEATWGPGSFLTNGGAGHPQLQIGDLFVVYALGPKICYAVVRVTGETTVNRQLQLDAGIPAEHADRWTWVTPVVGEAQVSTANGFSLDSLGLTGQSLQRGYCRLPIGGMATALRLMLEASGS